MGESAIPTIVQIIYSPRAKKESSCLFALDSDGQIWFTLNPLNNGFIWKRVLLPYELRNGDEEEAISG